VIEGGCEQDSILSAIALLFYGDRQQLESSSLMDMDRIIPVNIFVGRLTRLKN
jgi:hypothetical protein